uniref:Apple domain-containing protein n=1 Tax=Chlamydomonas euryale TaxID=1486919 RepID=A0A7R9W011_9CHLO|mmetsp:Transcript_8450/g.25585  ORF Transcript_8450/g.25585 Transcript_8450/m.25585 type:complete len:283 (+) Transcript_8450:451-1299(+)
MRKVDASGGSCGRPDPSVVRLAGAAVLAVVVGFLTFNLQHIISVSHTHFNLHDAHRSNAFCAFAKCEPKGAATASAPQLAGDAGNVAVEQLEIPTYTLTSEEKEQLSARVCGSPATDGYSHVDPKCLEESPTAKWWAEYFRRGFRQQDLVAHVEDRADFDGLAVKWGIGNKKASVEDCAAECLAHVPGAIPGPFQNLPCNVFTWCPDEVCFEPDAHTHTKGDCWLKFTEGPAAPELNYRGELGPRYRERHPTAPDHVQWSGGVILPAGMPLTNGTFGPRYNW